MFDSLSGGYAPILILSVLAAWALSRLCRPLGLRFVLAVLIPFGISLGWYFIPPYFMESLVSQDPTWATWGLVAAFAWSAVSVPASLLATLGFAVWNRRQKTKADSAATTRVEPCRKGAD